MSEFASEKTSLRKEQRRRVVISPLSVAILSPCSNVFDPPFRSV